MDEEKGIQLTSGGLKKLGNLVNLKEQMIADAIQERGGGQGQINQLQSDYQNLSVGELANLAASGDMEAETVIKILKQAKKKSDKYGNK
jgi:hypothetical protein